MSDFQPTSATKLKRHPERGAFDRPAVYAILDEAMICHVGFVDDGRPFVIPTLFARLGDRVVLHGSVGSRMLKKFEEGAEVCLTVTLLDGLVLARSAFSHSLNYRSVVILGRGGTLEDAGEKNAALFGLSEHVIRGRWTEVRGPNEKELKQTRVAYLPLQECSAKIRTGPPKDAAEDLTWPVWAGVIPLKTVPQAPEPDPKLTPGTPVPQHVLAYRGPTPVELPEPCKR